MNYSLELKIIHITKCEYNYFLDRENIIGIALGYKVTNGFYTGMKCLKVFVRKKFPCARLNPSEVIPKFYNGILTDVIEIGPLTFQNLTYRIRPVEGGFSISSSNIPSSGSMCCLVTDGEYNYILSNNHVLANINTAPLGTSIIQPGLFDGGDPSKDVIATLDKFIPIKFKSLFKRPINFVDCAIGKAVDPSILSPTIHYVGLVKGTKNAVLGSHAKKVGRSSDLTYGTIIAISGTFKLNFKEGTAIFGDQIITNYMSQNGDSGAPLIDVNDYIIGMLMSGNETISVYNPINKVFESLNVKLPTSVINKFTTIN